MSKDRHGNFFEDFELGMRLRHPTPRTLTEGDRSLYVALTGSRDALSSAETTAQRVGLPRRPLESLLVFNTAFGKTVPDISLNAVANLGYADMRFLAPVFSDDTLAVESEVIGLRENSNRQSGVVYVCSTAARQTGEAVLSWVRWVMVHKRRADAAVAPASVPALVDSVEPARLAVSQYGADVSRIVEATGVADLWDDYQTGERIDHLSGMTVNDSDHSLATRLYQNTAKAHFDGHRMAATPSGQRLVYGGHVMSICRALSYDGLENVLSILAINGGTHVAPTYAGDTLYCATMVLDKHELSNPFVGALRLRMIGAKNVEQVAAIAFPGTLQNRPKHADGVVLDLDYTVAIPRRTH
ncbi:MAG: MaoC family dehydratase [Burkholderiaceae bacterium]